MNFERNWRTSDEGHSNHNTSGHSWRKHYRHNVREIRLNREESISGEQDSQNVENIIRLRKVC